MANLHACVLCSINIRLATILRIVLTGRSKLVSEFTKAFCLVAESFTKQVKALSYERITDDKKKAHKECTYMPSIEPKVPVQTTAACNDGVVIDLDNPIIWVRMKSKFYSELEIPSLISLDGYYKESGALLSLSLLILMHVMKGCFTTLILICVIARKCLLVIPYYGVMLILRRYQVNRDLVLVQALAMYCITKQRKRITSLATYLKETNTLVGYYESRRSYENYFFDTIL